MKVSLLNAILFAVALPLGAFSLAPAATDGDVDVHVIHAGDHGESFSLKDLKDGESRTLGSGDHKATIIRTGESFEITTGSGDEVRTIRFNCSANDDDCLLLGLGEEGAHPMVFISSEDDGCPEGEEGEKCKRIETEIIALAGAHSIGDKQIQMLQLDGGEGVGIVHRLLQGLSESFSWSGDAGKMIVNVGVGDDEPRVIMIGNPDEVRLLCPEGDASLTVSKEEAEDHFFCPKHNVLMEKSRHKSRKIRAVIRETK